jgi:nitrogen-specific signal transduction histidine kinase
MVDLLIPAGLAISGVTFFWSAVFAWVEEEFPGLTWYCIFTLTVGIGALFVAFARAAQLPQAINVAAMIILGIVLPVPWILFSFAYTGQNEFLEFDAIALISILPVIGVLATLVIFSSQFIGWLQIPSVATATGSMAIVVTMLTSFQWFALLFAGGLLMIGSGLLVWLFQRYTHLNVVTGALLGVIGIVPWLCLLFAIQLVNVHRLASLIVLFVGFGIGAIAATMATGPTDHDLFENTPAPGRIAPTVIFDELENVVIVADQNGRIIELNEKGRTVLDKKASDIIGMDVEPLLGKSISHIRTASELTLQTNQGQRIFETSTSELTDPHGHCLGYAILLRDRTTQTTRQQRLKVLNRVLRHNLRNELNIVLGKADQLKTRLTGQSSERLADDISQVTSQTIALGDQIRDIEQTLNMPRSDMNDIWLEDLLSTVAERARDAHPGASINWDCSRNVLLLESEPLIDTLLERLVHNAIVHNEADTPRVDIRTDYRENETFALLIEVADNGPGIPKHEQEVIQAGTETPLEHSSGLGLWAVQWGMTSVGGKLDFAESPDRGAIVQLAFPREMLRR